MNNVVRPTRVLFGDYVRALFRQAGGRTILAVALLIGVGLTEGVGLLMLIPFLSLLGITDSVPSDLVAVVGRFWSAVGLPLTLPVVLAFYVGVVAVYAVMQRWSTIVNSKLSHAFTRSLRNELFDALTRVQWLQFTKLKSSEVNHTLTANLNVIDNGTYGLLTLISAVVIAMVNVAVAFTLSAKMAGVALIASLVLLLILRPLNAQSYKLGEAWRSTMSSLFGALMEHIGSMKLAKSYGAERAHIRNFNDLSCDLEHQANRFASILSATQMYYDIGAVVIIGVFFYTAVEIFHTPASHLLVMIVLFARLAPQFSWMQRTWQNILNMLPAYGAARDMSEQFGRFAEPISSEEDAPIVLRDKVEFKNVTFRYDKNEARPVLDGLSVSFPANRTTVILGPSGGGKSTLADLTTGLLNPDSGEILVDGSPLTGELTHTWRRSTAYVPQESFLFHATLRENLLWSRPDARDEDIAEALQLASADGFIERLPEGLDTVVGDRGLRLSGGERQRIALARALLRKPTLLLLDESTSQLDGENEKRIMEALDRLRGALTIVFISHRLSALDCADNVVVLDRGRVVEQESAERVKLAANGKVTAIR